MTVATMVLPVSLPVALHVRPQTAMTLSPSISCAQLVDHQAAVGVAVEGHAHVVPARHDALAEALEVRGAAAVVDVHAVRLAVDEVGIAAWKRPNSSGAVALAAPLAQSTSTRRPERSQSMVVVRWWM